MTGFLICFDISEIYIIALYSFLSGVNNLRFIIITYKIQCREFERRGRINMWPKSKIETKTNNIKRRQKQKRKEKKQQRESHKTGNGLW